MRLAEADRVVADVVARREADVEGLACTEEGPLGEELVGALGPVGDIEVALLKRDRAENPRVRAEPGTDAKRAGVLFGGLDEEGAVQVVFVAERGDRAVGEPGALADKSTCFVEPTQVDRSARL